METTVGVVSIFDGVVGAKAEAHRAAEGVGCAGDEDAVLGLGDEVEGVVGEEVGRDARDGRGGHAPEAVVGEGHAGGGVGVGDGGEGAGGVVGVGGGDAPRPGAGGELAVGGVGVGGAEAVGVELVGEEAGGVVVEPERGVEMGRVVRMGRIGQGDAGGQKGEEVNRLVGGVAGGGHGGHAAGGVVLVGDGVGGAPGGADAAFGVVGGVGDLAEGVGDGGAAAEGVIGIMAQLVHRDRYLLFTVCTRRPSMIWHINGWQREFHLQICLFPNSSDLTVTSIASQQNDVSVR